MNENYIQKIFIDWNHVSEDSYLKEITSICDLRCLEFNNGITFFTGENGTGKSTLLEAIAVAYGFNPEGGTLNYNFSTYDDVSELSNAIRISKGYRRPKGNYFFRAESFFNVASKLEEYRDYTPKEVFYERYGGKSLHEQSHGESFLSFFLNNQKEGLYIMDEPEAALSPQRQLSLFIQIAKMAEKGSQFIIATHSPILLGIPGASIYSFDNSEVSLCNYEETECYNVMKMFINDRELLISYGRAWNAAVSGNMISSLIVYHIAVIQVMFVSECLLVMLGKKIMYPVFILASILLIFVQSFLYMGNWMLNLCMQAVIFCITFYIYEKLSRVENETIFVRWN